MKAPKTHRKVRKIGPDVEDFEIDNPVPVVVQRTIKGRIIDLIWVITATLIALTVFNVLILPLF